MARDCDACDGNHYTEANPRVFGCQPRPSDKSEIVCTIAGHKDCFAPNETLPAIDAGSGWATASQWNDYIESAAAYKAGHLFLTL